MFVARRQASPLFVRRVATSSVVRTLRAPAMFRPPAVNKLVEILHEYSRNNFNQGLPTNFLTQIIDVAHEPDNGMIPAKSAVQALQKIKADNPLTEEDAWEIVQQELHVDNEDATVDEQKFMQLFYDHVKK